MNARTKLIGTDRTRRGAVRPRRAGAVAGRPRRPSRPGRHRGDSRPATRRAIPTTAPSAARRVAAPSSSVAVRPDDRAGLAGLARTAPHSDDRRDLASGQPRRDPRARVGRPRRRHLQLEQLRLGRRDDREPGRRGSSTPPHGLLLPGGEPAEQDAPRLIRLSRRRPPPPGLPRGGGLSACNRLLGLAARAVPRPAAADPCLRDRRAAARTGLAVAAVDPELLLHRARRPVRLRIGAERGALPLDSRYGARREWHGSAAPTSRLRDVVRGSQRAHARTPERFVGVDVPEPGHDPLIEEDGLERRAPAGELLDQPARGEPRPEWLRAVLRREVRLELRRPRGRARCRNDARRGRRAACRRRAREPPARA